ncbi:MAG TPA: hypothetical protein VMA77_20935 [Solirubrobacteraceae bacterium]|nr:hypothetical protein [Solirubrobacteraceae bacterium]
MTFGVVALVGDALAADALVVLLVEVALVVAELAAVVLEAPLSVLECELELPHAAAASDRTVSATAPVNLRLTDVLMARPA